jgi:hypothetical protein
MFGWWGNQHHLAGLSWRNGEGVRLRCSGQCWRSCRHDAERNTGSDSKNIVNDVHHSVANLSASGVNDQCSDRRIQMSQSRSHLQFDRNVDGWTEDVESEVLFDYLRFRSGDADDWLRGRKHRARSSQEAVTSYGF